MDNKEQLSKTHKAMSIALVVALVAQVVLIIALIKVMTS